MFAALSDLGIVSFVDRPIPEEEERLHYYYHNRDEGRPCLENRPPARQQFLPPSSGYLSRSSILPLSIQNAISLLRLLRPTDAPDTKVEEEEEEAYHHHHCRRRPPTPTDRRPKVIIRRSEGLGFIKLLSFWLLSELVLAYGIRRSP